MLFWTRSFLCIGTIVVLAEGLTPAATWDESKNAAAETAAGTIEMLCRKQPTRCLALAGSVAGAAIDTAEPRPSPKPTKARPPHAPRVRDRGAGPTGATDPPD